MAERPRIYRSVSQVDRNRLIDAYDRNEDWHVLLNQLGINESTARSITVQCRRNGRYERLNRGGARNIKVTNVIKEFMIFKVQEKPTITLKEIKAVVQEQFRVVGFLQTISPTLDEN